MDKKIDAAYQKGLSDATIRNIKIWAIEKALCLGQENADTTVKSARVFEAYVNAKLSRQR